MHWTRMFLALKITLGILGMLLAILIWQALQLEVMKEEFLGKQDWLADLEPVLISTTLYITAWCSVLLVQRRLREG